MASAKSHPPFNQSFARWARRVRGRLLARYVLTGVTVGLLLGVGVAALLWWQRWGELRPWASSLGAGGAFLGCFWGLGRRWSDMNVALYLDARLGGDEAVSTAVELSSEDSEPARAVVLDRARVLLATSRPATARPRVLHWSHAISLLGVAGVVALSIAPLPVTPPPPPPPLGAAPIQMAELQGLEKIIALEKLDARDAQQRQRLDAIAKEAKKLRDDLAKGIEKREAQARIAKLRDDIAAERLRFGNRENRPGLAAAIRKLKSHPELEGAAEALGNGDLTEFDQEMQKLANRAEKESRDAAKTALEEAAEAARERGAKELAEMLERQQQQFERQEAKAEALRELARQLESDLSDEARRDLEEFGKTGDPDAQRRLGEALEEALEGLSEEERQHLAEQLRQRLEEGSAEPMTEEQLESLKEQLESKEGREQLKKTLKDLANSDPSEDARRQESLNDAERGGAEAQKELGILPVPGNQPAPTGGGEGKAPDGSGENGSGDGGGQGEHDGQTERLKGDPLRAKAETRLDPSAPMRSGSQGRTGARAGETANQRGTGALGSVSDAEVESVERSEVPEEYREQVGRYFQP